MTVAAPLAAYARWQLRDSLPRLATPLVIFLSIGMLPLWALARQSGGFAAMRVEGQAQEMALVAYNSTLTLAMTLGAVLLATGVVALDRERQHFRFLFSHPVVPWQYYLQRFVVGAVMFSLVMALIPLGFSALVADVPVLPVITSSLMYALLYGSLATLCGALLNKDGILFIGVILIAGVLQQSKPMLPEWVGAVANSLPPIHVTGIVRAAWLAGRSADTGDLVLVGLYSLGLLAAALVLIRRAPLAR
ncbi:MAG: ABC transporter permease [Gemmatimonadaceae bacterium]